jgi:hypothetical protein
VELFDEPRVDAEIKLHGLHLAAQEITRDAAVRQRSFCGTAGDGKSSDHPDEATRQGREDCYKGGMATMNAELERFRENLYHDERLGLWLDTSRLDPPKGSAAELEPRIATAVDAMTALEAGGIANADENRMVGHYWLRAPELAPSKDITDAITSTLERILAFAASVHAARIRPERASRFRSLLVIGIGGSALGPELVAAALATPADVRDAVRGHLEVGRDEGDTERDARGRGGLREARPRLRQTRGGRDG